MNGERPEWRLMLMLCMDSVFVAEEIRRCWGAMRLGRGVGEEVNVWVWLPFGNNAGEQGHHIPLMAEEPAVLSSNLGTACH